VRAWVSPDFFGWSGPAGRRISQGSAPLPVLVLGFDMLERKVESSMRRS
jgi:hypothetical protein